MKDMISGMHFLNIAAISIDDALNPSPKAFAGPLHNLFVHEDAMVFDKGNEGFIGGMRALVNSSPKCPRKR